jgi:cytochrome P450
MMPDVAPGPRHGVPLLGDLPSFWMADRIDVHARDALRHGDVVRYQLGPLTAHMVLHPDDVRHVLQENHVNYLKGRGTQRLSLLLGRGLLTSEGSHWRKQRRLAQPAFHPKRVAALVDAMVDATDAMLAAWEAHARSGEPVDVASEMMRLTLDVVGRTLFGTDVKSQASAVYESLTYALEFTVKRLMLPMRVPMSVPLPGNRRFLRAKQTLDSLVMSIIGKRLGERRREGEGADLMSMLMDAKDEDTGESMSPEDLRDEVMTLVLAGHETTANALTWAFLLLSREPVVWRALRDEVSAVLGDRRVTADDLPKLRYARMVIEETMRLFPPVWMFGRTAIAEDRVRGYRIPPGSMVMLSPFLTHRHGEFWANPEGFDPTRFSAEAAAKRHKHAYFPFGGGPRVCIGNGFALTEATVVLAAVAQRYRVEVVPRDVRPEPMITLRPKGGLPSRIVRVSGSEAPTPAP